MTTALLLTNAKGTQRRLEELLGGRLAFIVIPAPLEPARDKFDGLLTTWLPLVDVVILDGTSIGETTRWAIESLVALATEQPVVFYTTPQQRPVAPKAWHVLLQSDSDDQVAQSLTTFLDLCEAKARLEQSTAQAARPTAPVAVPVFDSYRYRDALKTLSRALSQRRGEKELLGEFLRLVREFLSVGKLALLTRPVENGLFARSASGDQFRVACSEGVAPQVVEHFFLALTGGIGGRLSREACILRRDQAGDRRTEREFELLGAETAVPMFDNDQLVGILTFSGRITGGPMASEELELVYQLLSQLAQALQNLRLAERIAAHQRLFSAVLANVHSGVLVVGEGERILAINDFARQLLDLGTAELVGQPLASLAGRVGDVVFTALQQAGQVWEQEVVLPGSQRPLRVCVTRFEQADIGPVAVALLEDLTEAKLAQAHAREAADTEFLMRLGYRLSHELRNSLVAIKSFAQLLPERHDEPEFRDQFSQVLTNEVNRVDVLVNNLSFFSHSLDLVREEIALTELLDACVTNVAQESRRKEWAQVREANEKATAESSLPVVTVRKTLAHKTTQLQGDKLRLTQAIEQLLRNAIQSMPAGGRLSLRTSEETPGTVKIEVQDTGEGIALENLKRVTEPFFTTRNVGVGLGLTIVKKIMEEHGGRLELDSLLGQGTTVTLTLPVRTARPGEPISATRPAFPTEIHRQVQTT